KWLERVEPIKAFWQRLPKFHQRALMVLMPLLLLLLIVPLPKKTEPLVEPQGEGDSQRVAIQLNAQSLSQQRTSQNSGPKSED
ncbi:lysine transporter LysM, partial [Vibrio parahaemolyticus]|nr:lysine transporter LysM [Vibrio parahaemolyticus]